jgi:hypothetical protein
MPRFTHIDNHINLSPFFSEMHVNQLKLANQPIPHHAAVLLFNARRREERLQAKRISNRKSATNQREKKKTFLENLAKYNSTLRKKASILEKMPDLVRDFISQ